MPDRVAILGTGLIGSSMGLALKAAKPSVQIAGYDASGENLRKAQSIKAIDRRASLRDALADVNLVIISTPVGAMKALFDIAVSLAAGFGGFAAAFAINPYLPF